MYRIASTSIISSVRFGRPSFTCSTCLFATSQSGSDDHKKGKAMRVDRILVNRGMSGRKSIQKMMKEGRVFLVVDPDDSEKDVMISKGDIKIPGESKRTNIYRYQTINYLFIFLPFVVFLLLMA